MTTRALEDQEIKVKLMICLEMLGYYSDKKNSQKYPVGIMKLFYGDKADFIAVVERYWQGAPGEKIKKVMMKNSNIKVKYLKAPKKMTGVDFSDHLNYWRLGFKAIMITDTAFYRNPNHHQKTDTIHTLDFTKIKEVVTGLSKAVLTIQ